MPLPHPVTPRSITLAIVLVLLSTSLAVVTSLPLVSSNPAASHHRVKSVGNDDPPTPEDVRRFGLEPGGLRRAPEEPELDSSVVTGTHSKQGWLDPGLHGGSMLDLVGNGMREPINAIISGHSDPYVLTDAGMRDYVRSIGFSFECLDLHRGGRQRADLGDGNGWREEMFEYRSTQGFSAPGRWVGACWESWDGGNHFRAWKQNGTDADTGAWFLAVSVEKNLRHSHTIDKDGYNAGRDILVQNAMTGGKFKDRLWKADVKWVEGLMPAGSDGINHGIEIDGLTAVLNVQRHWTVPPTLAQAPSLVLTVWQYTMRTVEGAVQWVVLSVRR